MRICLIALWCAAVFTGCAATLPGGGGFTDATTPLGQRQYKVLGPGQATVFSTLFLGQFGSPDIEQAKQMAIARAGGDAMIDVVWEVEHRNYLLFRKLGVTVRGTVIKFTDGQPASGPGRMRQTYRTPPIQRGGLAVFTGGGLAYPIKPDILSDNYSAGFAGGAGFGYPVSPDGTISVVGYFNYHRFSPDFDIPIVPAPGSLNVLTVSGNLKISPAPGSKAAPYLLTGLAYSFDDGDIINGFGIGLGAGVDARMSKRLGLFIEAAYNIDFSKGSRTHYLPVKAGISFR